MLVILIKSSLTHLFEDQDYGNNILLKFFKIETVTFIFTYEETIGWTSKTLTLWKKI